LFFINPSVADGAAARPLGSAPGGKKEGKGGLGKKKEGREAVSIFILKILFSKYTGGAGGGEGGKGVHYRGGENKKGEKEGTMVISADESSLPFLPILLSHCVGNILRGGKREGKRSKKGERGVHRDPSAMHP